MLPVYNSLMSFKQFLFKSLGPVLQELGTVTRDKSELESVAEDYHRALTYLGLSHFNLKSEYDRGERRFREQLWQHLNNIRHRVPATVSIDTLTHLCVKYFRANF